VKALVASLGLTGFALGFALKDIISNSLARVLILFYKPFHPGDHIDVAGSEGIVSSVDMRYTTLIVNAGQRVLVPNSNLFTNTIRVTDKDQPPAPVS
jgi:small conductance mechanosensitive channel